MATELEAKKNSALPAHLQAAPKVKIGNLDSSDRIIPRIKLIQGISPEVTTYEDAKAGEFWHTLAEKSLGRTVRVVAIRVQKSLMLWAPRGDERGILARSVDGKTWDKPNESFEVKLKTSPKKQIWETKGNVAESGLDKFGSSVKEDTNSAPAAALTYSWVFLPIDYLDLGVGIVINSRSAVKPAKLLWSKLESSTVAPYYRIFSMSTVEQVVDGDKFYNYQFTADGFVEDTKVAELCESLAIEFEKIAFRSSDEEEDTQEGGGNRPKGEVDEKMANKF